MSVANIQYSESTVLHAMTLDNLSAAQWRDDGGGGGGDLGHRPYFWVLLTLHPRFLGYQSNHPDGPAHDRSHACSPVTMVTVKAIL